MAVLKHYLLLWIYQHHLFQKLQRQRSLLQQLASFWAIHVVLLVWWVLVYVEVIPV